jgi:Skp family chaperone for outer membrane proteins
MNSKHIAAAVAALALASTAQAFAQTHHVAAAPAAAAAPAVNAATLQHGPPIPGVCIFSDERAVATSAVGKAFETRMQQLRAQAAAELSGEQTSLRNDVQAFQGKRASLTQEQQQQQAAPLAQREEAFNQKAQQRQAEMEYTARHQLSRINQTLTPLVQSIYQQRHCSLLLSAEAVMGANPAMDITDAVVAQLNSRMSTITFDRETPPAGAQ